MNNAHSRYIDGLMEAHQIVRHFHAAIGNGHPDASQACLEIASRIFERATSANNRLVDGTLMDSSGAREGQ